MIPPWGNSIVKTALKSKLKNELTQTNTNHQEDSLFLLISEEFQEFRRVPSDCDIPSPQG